MRCISGLLLSMAVYLGATVLGTTVLGAAPPVETQNPHQALLAYADSLVTVRFVLKVKMDGGGGNEFSGEITCQLIDAQGLVLCSNTELGGYVTLMSRTMGRSAGISAVPAEIEVVLSDRTTGLEGRLMTRDTDRDLAWILIEDYPDDSPRAFLDFSKSAELEVGEKLYNLRRLHKFLGSEPVVTQGILIGKTKKPRRLLVPSNAASPGFGVPVFDAGGSLVGITVLQLPGAEDDAARLFGNPMAALGTSVSLQDMISGLILPAAEVVKATELAREIFAEDLAEQASEDRP